MATLPTQDTDRIWRGLMRYWSNTRDTIPITKSQLKDAVLAVDSWVDTNSASFNSALPAPARNNLTATQKSLLLCAVVLMRFSIDLLRGIFGEVD